MGEAERTHVLQRKARTGRDEHQARVMTPQRALRLALARVADELLDLALSVSSIHVSETGQDGAISAMGEDRLIVVLDGPKGAAGAVALDLAVLAGLIEMQTMGRILGRDPELREPTQTDAALVAPLIDGMLAGFAENLDDDAAGWAAGYRFGAMIEGPRMLGLLFQAPDFHVFRMEVTLGGGTRTGEIVLALPVAAPVTEACTGEAGSAEAQAGGRLRLGQGALMGAEARLSAVLHRVRLPLTAIAALKPGKVLNIPREALFETHLEAGVGRGGIAIACRLGQINGFRAVRLTVAPGFALSERNATAEEDREAAEPERPGFAPKEARPALTDAGGAGAAADEQAFAGGFDLPEAGGRLSNLPDSLPDLPELPDLENLPDPGVLADLSDLPELALDE